MKLGIVLLLLSLGQVGCFTPKPCVVPMIHVWTLDDPAPATLAERVKRAEQDPTLCRVQCVAR